MQKLCLRSCTQLYIIDQDLSQDLESGCPKLAIVKYLGIQCLKRDHSIVLKISIINMYLLHLISNKASYPYTMLRE